MGCHKHKNAHNRKWKDSQCLNCHKQAGKTELKPTLLATPTTRARMRGSRSLPDTPTSSATSATSATSTTSTPAECGVRCHQDSLHRGSLGDECSRCHSSGVWDATRFDHNDDTKWELKGMHSTSPSLPRLSPGQTVHQYAQDLCAAEGCHAKDDVHKGALGSKCETCHVETGELLFDHNRMADFQLDGRHLDSKCSECHPKITFKPRPKDCFGCHPEPKVHKGQYGTVCETCHSTSDWRDIKALHDVGDFALKGSHDNIPCQSCHLDNRPLWPGLEICALTATGATMSTPTRYRQGAASATRSGHLRQRALTTPQSAAS